MKKIALQITFNSIRSRKDGSLGISIETPELSVEEKVEIMKLQNEVLEAVLTPLDLPNVPEYKVNADLEQKTPSERQRAIIWRIWESKGKQGDFNSYYRNFMDKVCEELKRRYLDV